MSDHRKDYVSEADAFLAELHADKRNWTDSVEKEIRKHQRIAELRDNPNAKGNDQKLWSDF
ncbi:MAG: hypothetical protein D6694_01175 [Gammaproteobacteria bacterium]|jgi:hypothetical protein|nr:MAG: hypothetical protein D6694_01175 [Gammaproteobacteria bacterium]